MVNRYLGGERPAPRAGGRLAAGATAGRTRCGCTGSGSRAAGCTTRSRSCGSSSAARTRRSTPSSRGRSTRRPRRATPRRRPGCAGCSATSSRRAGSSASPSRRSCRRSRRASSSSSASPTATPPTATADRRSSSASRGAPRPAPGRVTDTPTPLFPRVESEAAEAPAGLIVRLVDSHGHVNADRFARRRRARPRRGPPRRRRADPRPGLEPRVVRAGPRARRSLPVARRGGRRPPARRGQGDRRRLGGDRGAGRTTSGCVAIGETGLDSDRMFSPWEAQLENLRRNLALALATGKPAILHCRSKAGDRDAQDALLAELRSAGFDGPAAGRRSPGRPPAVIHSFSGPVDYARDVLAHGPRHQLQRPRVPGRRGGVGRGRRARPGRTGCWSRPTPRS